MMDRATFGDLTVTFYQKKLGDEPQVIVQIGSTVRQYSINNFLILRNKVERLIHKYNSGGSLASIDTAAQSQGNR